MHTCTLNLYPFVHGGREAAQVKVVTAPCTAPSIASSRTAVRQSYSRRPKSTQAVREGLKSYKNDRSCGCKHISSHAKLNRASSLTGGPPVSHYRLYPGEGVPGRPV